MLTQKYLTEYQQAYCIWPLEYYPTLNQSLYGSALSNYLQRPLVQLLQHAEREGHFKYLNTFVVLWPPNSNNPEIVTNAIFLNYMFRHQLRASLSSSSMLTLKYDVAELRRYLMDVASMSGRNGDCLRAMLLSCSRFLDTFVIEMVKICDAMQTGKVSVQGTLEDLVENPRSLLSVLHNSSVQRAFASCGIRPGAAVLSPYNVYVVRGLQHWLHEHHTFGLVGMGCIYIDESLIQHLAFKTGRMLCMTVIMHEVAHLAQKRQKKNYNEPDDAPLKNMYGEAEVGYAVEQHLFGRIPNFEIALANELRGRIDPFVEWVHGVHDYLSSGGVMRVEKEVLHSAPIDAPVIQLSSMRDNATSMYGHLIEGLM